MLNILSYGEKAKTNGLATAPLFSETDLGDTRRVKAWLDARFKSARALPAGEFISEVVTITPAMAEYILLHHNDGNRPVRTKRVAEFEEIIRTGRWKVNSQGISFARCGALNNGQHRLNGIVAAAKPVPIYVTFGEDRAAYDVLDTGAVRGGSDTLHVLGYKNTAALAAAARLIHNIETATPGSNIGVGNDQIGRVVDTHPGLEAATTPGQRVGKRFRASTAAATVAFYYIATQSAHKRRLDHFINRLIDGAGLAARDPILVLRDGLQTKSVDSHVRGSTSKGAAQAAAIIKAWNLWVRGKRGQIRWSSGEPFPRPE